MERADRAVPAFGQSPRGVAVIPVKGGEQHTDEHEESKWDRQMGTLKQNFGPSSVVALISGVLSAIAVVITILVAVGSPFAKQVETNTVVTGLERAVREQKDEQAKARAADKEEQARALADGVARIEALVARSIDLSQQNRDELRSIRDSNERQIVALSTKVDQAQTKADSAWNWMLELKNRIGIIEAEATKRK